MSTEEQEQVEKKYDPLDSTLKFVDKPDDLDPYSDGSLKAEMSCGHAVTPESLTLFCQKQLEQSNYKFRCPALVDGTKRCNKEWSYQEIRRLADLTVEEMQKFEESMARLAVEEYCQVQECPQCNTSVERKDLSNLCVKCVVCTADQKKTYQFCWQCRKQWKSPGLLSDRCGNDGCVNHDLELLKNCKTTDLPKVRGVNACPSIRACPTCGEIVEHDKTGCKNIICPRCHKEFCFVCLKLTPECLKTSSYFSPCSDGVAPRQTSIPVWCRK
ncbi:probable E3 ubiquitin-protein ligase ARI8 [Archocentrus centrarchus]|uniref:probable E3 ubiquitin-protein ligase ARI8 n=1 Tax=Archocentrus centrarchus TaxID=63155 RepID=UPI0011EA1E42|nr:probable E3 ubiquitin-protein ligase ARI8 [Archocentrus centrarchus]XP_030609167.1 probable E3 ubiquitin-protein ligase ARI8 [Archocentrus centrarchus]